MRVFGLVIGCCPMRTIAILSLALTGCASTQSILSDAPDEVLRSAKDPRDVAFCLQNKSNGQASELSDGSRVVVAKNPVGGVLYTFTVRADGSGSNVEFRRVLTDIGIAWRQCLAD